MPDLEQDYLLLDVSPDASVEEIREAYLLLVNVWHPDRFAEKPQLVAKATAKLQAINEAFERISTAPLRKAASSPHSPRVGVAGGTAPPVPRPAPDVETLRRKLSTLQSSEGWVAQLVTGARSVALDCEGCGTRRQHVLMQVPYGVSVAPPILRMFMKRPWWSSHKGYFLVCDTCADYFRVDQQVVDRLMGKVRS